MGLFADRAGVEIRLTSGALRVSVRPQPTLASLLLTAALIVAFVAASVSAWRRAALVERIGEILITFGAVFAWFQQLSGSEEEIEIGEQGIRIRREVFGWSRISEYSLEQCSDLDLQTTKDDSHRLQFRLGKWRTIEFGNYMSEKQAENVLNALADSLPEIARKLLPSLDITKHWNNLHLS
jgi:hypothetical protein